MNSLEPVPFAISTAKGNSPKNIGSEVTNLYVQMEEPGGKSNHILINSEGYDYISSSNYIIWGMYAYKGYMYIATSLLLYRSKITQTREVNFTLLEYVGDIVVNQKVIFTDNGIDIMLVGKNGYAYNPETRVFKNMSVESGWYDSDMVTYMDGYFIFNRSGTGQFFISKLYSTELNPLDWATGESAPDDTVGVIVASRQLWVIGERSTEVWYDSGDELFPFTRISGAVTDIGCENYSTIATTLNSVFFVGNDLKVYMTVGYTPQVISTNAIEGMLENYVDRMISGFIYHIGGVWRYVLQIDENTTMSYDLTSGQWTRRSSVDLGRWNIRGAVNIYDTGRVFGYTFIEFNRLSMNLTKEAGEPIRRSLTSLPLNKGVNRFRLAEVQIDAETGLGREEEENDWWIETSTNGGRSWGTAHPAQLGDWGEDMTRIRWLRLGMFRDCTLRFSTYSKRAIRIISLFIRRA